MEHIGRVGLEHTVKHILDFVGSGEEVAYDKRVKTLLVDKLKPSHIYLNYSRATPLTRLQKNDADRFSGDTKFLETGDEATLRTVEREKHILAAAFALDVDKSGSPEGEVVSAANAEKFLHHQIGKRVAVIAVFKFNKTANASGRLYATDKTV